MVKNRVVADSELFYATVDLILGSKKTLVLIQPNLSRIEHLLEKLQEIKKKGAEIYIVTKPEDKDSSHKKSLIFLENLGCKVFTDPMINGRLIIRDQDELLTSSADLSKTASDRNFDVGIRTNDKDLINKALDYAEKLMQVIDKKRKKHSQG